MSKVFQRRALLPAAIVPALMVAGCATGGDRTQAMKAVATVSPTATATATAAGRPRAAVESYFNALKSGNVDQIVGAFAANAVVEVDGEATAQGVRAIRGLYQQQLHGATDLLSAKHKIEDVREVGAEGAVVRSTSKQGDANYRELFVLTKEGGKWKISEFMNNQSA
ncbi:nuclear transport factor 2 family protein [Nonomuraea sp. NPDC005650]|uniref:nuclear transport factor 2 family protein n=1 Tax=Nonomuraea sp. NPDC005650 TaxID=3157045 RepID=UPI0033A0FFAB